MFMRKCGLRGSVCGLFIVALYLGLAQPALAWDKPLWVRQLKSAGYDFANGVATDRNGNVYIAGETTGSPFVAKYSPAGAVRWIQQFGTNSFGFLRDLTTDHDGNVYIASCSDPAFIAKLSAQGKLRWSREIDGQQCAEGIASDGDSNLYVVGWSMGGIEWAWAAKYSPDGILLWIKGLGWIRGYESGATGVATDHDGNVYIAGWLRTTSDGDTDGWIAKYSAAGILRWKRYIRSISKPDYSDEIATGIATDNAGNVYVGGSTGGDAFIVKYTGGGALRWRRHLKGGYHAEGLAIDEEANVYIAGGYDKAYVAKYSAAGALRWRRQPEIPDGDATPRDVASDGANNVYVAGEVWPYSPVGPDAWLMKYSTRR
ncbi:MAG: SBBP repeat-containing protein [Rhodospirillales bacterium]